MLTVEKLVELMDKVDTQGSCYISSTEPGNHSDTIVDGRFNLDALVVFINEEFKNK